MEKAEASEHISIFQPVGQSNDIIAVQSDGKTEEMLEEEQWEEEEEQEKQENGQVVL